ncbi:MULTISPECIES: RNA polymerase sigma factor [Dyella]|uniref:Sigma-70 family RNA polymerase sigma factor n=2 Tax=Dyella TaxID=231454 RepID=A0A4R0YH13_9GAMM|nr:MULTISPECIES: sigma-70 family RNA polymerase sigma factor [Dyella]TBR37271.1 sigma-70 family RNA polymerase sigma factor [Dyella terrae]TCI07639.1 sigma-70 family RNA polymerase sigma factor [Dyella soli]
MDDTLDDWFIREILVHEAALTRLLQRLWLHRDDIHDLRQEVYVRVYEAAGKALPNQPKAFLFSTARHLVTDRLRRSRVVAIDAVGDLEALNVLIDELTPERRLDGRQILKQLAEAFDGLPARCREVVWMRKVQELPQKIVAEQLQITEKTVEKQVAKGIRLIADHFYGARAPEGSASSRPTPGQSESSHGQQQTD